MQEIKEYVKLKQLPFTDEIVEEMFKDAICGRGYITDKQFSGPLTQEEIAAAVRGRHSWNTQLK